MPHVLIVDDEPHRRRELARRIVAADGGFRVSLTTPDDPAVQHHAQIADVIVLGHDNGSVAERIEAVRALNGCRNILALGGPGDPDAVIHALRAAGHHAAGCCAAPARDAHGNGTLTPRETQVLEQLRTGGTMREIARVLTISRRTVERHLYNACGKLDAQGRTEAVEAYVAMQEGRS